MRLPKNTQVAAIQEEDENEHEVVQERDRDDYIPKQDQHSMQVVAGGDSHQKQNKLTIIPDVNDKKESKGHDNDRENNRGTKEQTGQGRMFNSLQ